MEVMSFAVTAGLLQGALQKPIEAMCSHLAKVVKGASKRYKTSEVMPKLADRIEELGRVRTLFHDQPVPLTSIYYPCSVRDPSKRVHQFQYASDFGSTHVGITGTLGQGKSMYMRWLSLNEAMKGETIPVFIELRKIDETCNLERLLVSALDLLGFEDLDAPTLSHIFDQGRLTIFADGFDEVSREFALPLQNDINALAVKYSKTRWVVSCRPGGLESHLHSTHKMRFFALQPLTPDDLDGFFKLTEMKTAQRHALLKKIDETEWNIKEVLTTPLMARLLAATFCENNGIPASLHEFYLSMFYVSARRHDNLKELQRERATRLADENLLEVFETFCYRSKAFSVSLTDDQFQDCAKDAAAFTSNSFHANALKTDLVEVICLMMKDGLRTAFIHKGVQEFFTASFIRKAKDPQVVEAVYKTLRGPRSQSWHEEIKFLKEIDTYRYYELFRIPVIEQSLQSLQFDSESRTTILKANFMNVMRDLCLGILRSSVGGNRLLVLSLHAEHVNPISHELFCGPDMIAVSVRPDVMEAVDPARVESWASYVRANPEKVNQWLVKVRERAASLHREKERLKRQVAQHKQDVTKVLMAVAKF